MVGEIPVRYTVAIPVYEGPLDLLLNLIEQAELDITRVALAQVTDQFLKYLKDLQFISPDEVSAFLVVAARLIQIKSEALLPRPPTRAEGEEDPGEALARQLRTYKRFKELSMWLGEREQGGYRSYLRLAPPPRIESRLDMSQIGLDDLVEAALTVLNEGNEPADVGNLIQPSKITIRDRISKIIGELRNFGRARFSSVLGKSTDRVELVVTFLAVLELVKRRKILAVQQTLFGEIEILPSEGVDLSEEFILLDDLEFEFDDPQK